MSPSNYRRPGGPLQPSGFDLLIIGEAALTEAELLFPPLAPVTHAGKRLAGLLDVPSVLEVAATTNLLLQPVPRWKRLPARAAATHLLRTRYESHFLLCGAHVADAFGFEGELFVWQPHRGKTMALFPHPANKNRWWNDPANRELAQAFLVDAVKREWHG